MPFPVASSSTSVSALASASTTTLSTCRQRLLSTSSRLSQAPTPRPTLPLSHHVADTRPPRTTLEAYQRYPNHPLNAFFQIKKITLPNPIVLQGQTFQGEVSLPVSLVAEDMGKDPARRSWMAPELRRKSSVELHQLWYVQLMEMNRMATKWEELRRNGLTKLALHGKTNITTRSLKLKKSMGRIKLVLNERRLALLAAASEAREKQRLAMEAARAEKVLGLQEASTTAAQIKEAERREFEDRQLDALRRESEGAEEFSMGGQEQQGSEGVGIGQGQQESKRDKTQ